MHQQRQRLRNQQHANHYATETMQNPKYPQESLLNVTKVSVERVIIYRNLKLT